MKFSVLVFIFHHFVPGGSVFFFFFFFNAIGVGWCFILFYFFTLLLNCTAGLFF